MRIELNQPHLSIKRMEGFDLPGFSVLIGRNGVGKTQLLDAIAAGHASVSDLPISEIEKYDITTFQPRDSGQFPWGAGVFAETTAEKYFSRKSGTALAELAKKIFTNTVKTFQLREQSDEYRQFEGELRNKISQTPDFKYFTGINDSEALSAYSQKILTDVIGPLRPKKQQSRTSRSDEKGTCGNDSAILLSLAMKLTGKLPHELLREDILRAAYYEGDTIANNLSQAFTRYKVEQYSWAHTQGEVRQDSIQSLMSEYRQLNQPPWALLRENLDRMRDASDDPQLFNFEFSDPETDEIIFADHLRYSFAAAFTNRATGESYSVTSLSSGEKILMSLYLAAFNQTMGRRRPKLVLLDELDALLHPSMVSALIKGLKDQFVNNGTQVIMATHSVTTVSMLEEREIFRVARSGGKVDVRPVLKSEAVSELSEGLATIDTGLRIAASGGEVPITILTEGNNTLHLKRWAKLFFPGKVKVFEDLPDKTSKDQLLTYGRLLAKMNASSHFLIVWDCDAKGKAKELSNELLSSAKVTAFSFEKQENRITSKGIENMYDEEILEPYSKIILDGSTREETHRSFDGAKKAVFARHVFSDGTTEYFKHFDDLRISVEEILQKSR